MYDGGMGDGTGDGMEDGTSVMQRLIPVIDDSAFHSEMPAFRTVFLVFYFSLTYLFCFFFVTYFGKAFCILTVTVFSFIYFVVCFSFFFFSFDHFSPRFF